MQLSHNQLPSSYPLLNIPRTTSEASLDSSSRTAQIEPAPSLQPAVQSLVPMTQVHSHPLTLEDIYTHCASKDALTAWTQDHSALENVLDRMAQAGRAAFSPNEILELKRVMT